MKKVAIVVGTRPECIKLAPVYFELKRSAEIEPILLATAQHRQMLDQTLGVFGLTPDYDLDLMQTGQSLESLTARLITSVSHWCDRVRPNMMLVQGDTTTVLATALSAFYKGIPVGHVEAGLRTGNMRLPFPEEMNRRLTTPLVRWNFCPTEMSKANLLKESIDPSTIFVTGNTVIDALNWVRNHFRELGIDQQSVSERAKIPESFRNRFIEDGSSRWVLVTGHRRESFGDGFENICAAILELANRHPNVGFLFPVHLNPQVRKTVYKRLGHNNRIALIEPVDYAPFVWLMSRAFFILSDSGGIQEEAPSLGKPVLVTRETTERPEAVIAGVCRLVGTDKEKIVEESTRLLDDDKEYEMRSRTANPYGDGKSSLRIREIMEN
jgi:UDP-N-acetylglucosamine 2-epimerase (non-hydrolysing)